jgi:GSH-dependent disulfide-bond oxidoreductase
MIDLHYWPTPNGHKATIALEEMGLPYTIHRVDIGKGDQFKPEFLKIAPNNRMPAITDHQPKDGGDAISLFESGAILQYLGEKTGKFLSTDIRLKTETMQWLFWQMGGLGPMAGQSNHFNIYAKEKLPYAMQRYANETGRLFGVLNKRLADREFMAGEYSIADMASYPWTLSWTNHNLNIDDFPNIKRWQATISARPAVVRAYAKAGEKKPLTEEERKVLFDQDAKTVKA